MQEDGNWNGEAAEETNASPRKKSHQSRGAQPVCHSSLPLKTAQLGHNAVSSCYGKLRGNCKEALILRGNYYCHQFYWGRTLPLPNSWQPDCLGSVSSSGVVNADGSKASVHWKENCFCSRKAQACTSTEEEIIFSKLSGKDLIKGTAQTVYSAAASNRYLELGERLPW